MTSSSSQNKEKSASAVSSQTKAKGASGASLGPSEALQSQLLLDAGFAHAFYTRNGGVSSGIFDSLNFVANTGDSPKNVKENLRRVGEHLGVLGRDIFFLSQVHGVEVHLALPGQDQEAVLQKEGDIVISNAPEVAAAIRTADCVPVLLACPETGWVAACHSGWMGCVRKAATAAVQALQKRGAKRLLAAIGPHISSEAFFVDEDVVQQLLASSPDQNIVDRSGEKARVDLRKMVRSQLIEAGLQSADIDDVFGCTVLEEERFYSFRRDKNPSGRMLSAIVARRFE